MKIFVSRVLRLGLAKLVVLDRLECLNILDLIKPDFFGSCILIVSDSTIDKVVPDDL